MQLPRKDILSYVILTALLLVPCVATSQNQIAPAIIQGQLINGAKAPVPAALVQWTIVGANPGQSGSSDKNGNFAFEIPVSGTAQVQLSITANLFNAAQQSVQIAPGQITPIVVTLTKKPATQLATVTGVVRNLDSGLGF